MTTREPTYINHIDGDPNNNDPADPDVARDGSGQSRQSAYRARRVAAGSVQKSFLLPADVVEKLERLGVVYGSQTKAIEAAIIALSASKDEWRDDFDNAPSQACIALISRLGNERRYLSVAKTEGERALRTVWISQIEREIANEESFLGMTPATGGEMTDAELLAELTA